MTGRVAAMLPVAGIIVILVLMVGSPVAAHSGEDVSLEHVVVEVGTWALGIIAVIAAIVAVFWVRARRQGGDE